MKNTGILRIQAFGARQSSPIEGVLVTVSGNGFTAQRITDETGTAADLSIEAPSCALSLQEDNTIRPYAVVDLTAAKAGFRTVRIQGVHSVMLSGNFSEFRRFRITLATNSFPSSSSHPASASTIRSSTST